MLKKDVASALSDLINTIKLVSSGSLGSSGGTASNQQEAANNQLSYSGSLLSESAKVMITNIQSLLKTVKTVEDEAQRGTRALESAIDAIHQEIKFNSGSNLISSSDDLAVTNGGGHKHDSANHFSADDLIKSTKQITLATSKAIGAANSLRQGGYNRGSQYEPQSCLRSSICVSQCHGEVGQRKEGEYWWQ